MAALLRKSKSTIQRSDQSNVNKSSLEPLPAADSSKGIIKHWSSSIRRRRRSRADISTSVESEASFAARQQRDNELSKQNSITQLKRRLVRKASTFNLHSRHHNSSQKDPEKRCRSDNSPLKASRDEAVLSKSTASSQQKLGQLYTPSILSSQGEATTLSLERSCTNNSISSRITAIPTGQSDPASFFNDHLLSDSNYGSVDHLVARAQQEILRAQKELVSKYPNYKEKHIEGLSTWAKMAAQIVEPPLPYEKLKQITVEACDSTLSSTTSYDHSKTEFWNTTIINTILSQLVGETTPAAAATNGASAPPSQSKWKFVVNSTIIQHRSNAAEDAKGKTTGGRRGMHSAAGAYWNNEKDGMWSFKYEAAEKMGLDVIVGIVWVWVG